MYASKINLLIELEQMVTLTLPDYEGYYASFRICWDNGQYYAQVRYRNYRKRVLMQQLVNILANRKQKGNE